MITSKTKIVIDPSRAEGNLLLMTELSAIVGSATWAHDFDITDYIHSVEPVASWKFWRQGLVFKYEDTSGKPEGTAAQLDIYSLRGQFLTMRINKHTGAYRIMNNSIPADRLSVLELVVNRANLNRRARKLSFKERVLNLVLG